MLILKITSYERNKSQAIRGIIHAFKEENVTKTLNQTTNIAVL